MTFTEYLRRLVRAGELQSSWACIDHDAWPDGSTRLEDYEAFLQRHIGGAQREVVPEVRGHWSQWSAQEGIAHGQFDVALAAWRDYALHVRDCSLMPPLPCPRADELLAKAVAQSRYQDLAINEPDPIPCEPPGARFLRELKQLLDQFLEPNGVIPAVLPPIRRSSFPKPPRSKS